MKSKFSLVLFILCISIVSARDDLRVISSTEQSITLEYNLKITNTGSTTINGEQSYDIDIYLGSDNRLPNTSFNIGVPTEFGNTIEVLSTQHSFLNGKLVQSTLNGYSSEEVIIKDIELISFDEFGISRDLMIQTIRINPVKYDETNKQIKLYNKIIFKITYGPMSRNDFVRIDKNKKTSNLINDEIASKWGLNRTSLRKINSSSVLATGTWYRFEAPEEGVYKIERTQLSALGIDAASVDPRTIKIYNQGGKRLNWTVEHNDPTDLNEVAIQITGEEDGRFDANDAIIFYGRGTDFWEFDDDESRIRRFHNPYSKKNYFWITSGGSEGKRISTIQSTSSSSPYNQTQSKAFKSLDEDNINIGKSGLDYYGDKINISNNTLTYITPLPGIVSNSQINYSFKFTNTTFGLASLAVSENDQQFTAVNLPGYGSLFGDDREYSWGNASLFNASLTKQLPDDRSVLKFKLSSSSSDAEAYIDYYEIEYLKNLRAYEDELLIFSDLVNNQIELRAFNFSNSLINIFDITDFSNVSEVLPSRLSGGEVTFQVQGSLDFSKKYLVVAQNKFNSISNIESVQNSNIHEISNGAEYIVITDRKFTEQAERLVNYRQNESPHRLLSAVVYTDEIMNEFSGGSLDPTAIRNFLRHAYLNWEVKPFYVLLLGDGTYDYYDAEGFGTNYVPTFQTENSMQELRSYPYDDYYSRIIGEDRKADLAIGRVNVLSNTQASDYVDKIISYENSRGQWRNKITLVGDDGITSTSSSEGSLHINQAEIIATEYIPEYFSLEKIYLPKYPTVISGFGRRKPAVNEAIINAVNNGTLILNYTGHGNPDVWAHEFVFERATTIPALNNENYFFLTAATCDFGLYDNPNSISGTEELLLLKNSGAIGVFSASRVVYSDKNARINEDMFEFLLETEGILTVGEAYFNVKQTTRNIENDDKFHLFADPALRISSPSKDIRIDKVNNAGIEDSVNIGALSEVTIEGSIRNDDGSVDSQFSGEGIVSVFDAERRSRLEEIRYTYTEQGGILFRGRVSAEAGRFNASFRVPKDISYEENTGKIVAYFFNEQEDGIGFRKNIFINGTDSTITNDAKGPEIEFFFDDLSASAAYLVNPDFNLFVKLNDETGLNTTGTGVGHKLEGTINDDDENPIDFSNFFIGDLDAAGKSGTIDYKFTDMPLGEHKINIKAWDVFNNSTTAESFFTVVSSDDLTVKDVLNYPNPFGGNTTFTFQHNLSDQLDVKIKVYTIAGRVIKEIESKGETAKFVRIPWDGRDEDGNELANGTYLYKLIVKSINGEYQKSVLGKLAVFR